jgi:hypothetical protein
MKTVLKIATLALMTLAVSVYGFSQKNEAASKALNLERGVVGPLSSNTSWAGYSALSLIPGAGLIPISSKTTAFYLGFVGGSEADVSNMVLYTTARASLTITAVTPVTLGGVSNPSIDLASTKVCPSQPPSTSNPCIVRLDPLTLTLSALNDYYLVVYFTANDDNNNTVSATDPNLYVTSLEGWFISSDETQLTVGSSIPSGNTARPPYFLMYVMTD